MAANDAYDKGYDAYWEGIDVGNNPHDKETGDYSDWEKGWRTARKHDYDESEG